MKIRSPLSPAPRAAMAPVLRASSARHPAHMARASKNCSDKTATARRSAPPISPRRRISMAALKARARRCPAALPHVSPPPTCCCMAATTRPAICSKAPRTWRMSAASRRPRPRSDARRISSCSIPPIPTVPARAPLTLRSPGSCAGARSIRASSRGRCATARAARPNWRRPSIASSISPRPPAQFERAVRSGA